MFEFRSVPHISTFWINYYNFFLTSFIPHVLPQLIKNLRHIMPGGNGRILNNSSISGCDVLRHSEFARKSFSQGSSINLTVAFHILNIFNTVGYRPLNFLQLLVLRTSTLFLHISVCLLRVDAYFL